MLPSRSYSILALSVLLGACAPAPTSDLPLRMTWTPVDSLSEGLPTGMEVVAGTSELPPLRAWYVRIPEQDSLVETRVVVSEDTDGLTSVSQFAADLGACVVVNGGYYVMEADPARHAGLLWIDHDLVASATPSVRRSDVRYETARGAIGFAADGTIDVSWATTRDDTVYAWPNPPAHTPGATAEPLDYGAATPWPVRDAVAAGPVLVADGEIRVTVDEEVFFGTAIPDIHPRTAAGYSEEGELIVMVVDGRQPASRGVNLEELAQLMLEAGAVEAVNLDGGGSSTLVVNGRLVNRPTGGMFEREVMSALATFCQ